MGRKMHIWGPRPERLPRLTPRIQLRLEGKQKCLSAQFMNGAREVRETWIWAESGSGPWDRNSVLLCLSSWATHKKMSSVDSRGQKDGTG